MAGETEKTWSVDLGDLGEQARYLREWIGYARGEAETTESPYPTERTLWYAANLVDDCTAMLTVTSNREQIMRLPDPDARYEVFSAVATISGHRHPLAFYRAARDRMVEQPGIMDEKARALHEYEPDVVAQWRDWLGESATDSQAESAIFTTAAARLGKTVGDLLGY